MSKMKDKKEDSLMKDLVTNISLICKNIETLEESIWVEFHEISNYYLQDYILVNEDKRKLFESRVLKC